MTSEPFKVIIVGAGVAGLACAAALASHKNIQVTVFERECWSRRSRDVVHLPPNACQALLHMCLGSKVSRISSIGNRVIIRDGYSVGKELYDRNLREHYYAPWYHVKHGDLVFVLYEEALLHGANIRYDSKVKDFGLAVHSDRNMPGQNIGNRKIGVPRVLLEDGTVELADLVIRADGAESIFRKAMAPNRAPNPSRTYMYRVPLPPLALERPEFDSLKKDAAHNVWVGKGGHVELVPQTNPSAPPGFGSTFDFQAIFTDDDDWVKINRSGAKTPPFAELLNKLNDDDWNPLVISLANWTVGLAKEPIFEAVPLDHLNMECVAVVGDAAHPSRPYLYQDAAFALEDAIVLKTVVSGILDGRPEDRDLSLHDLSGIMTRTYSALQAGRAATMMRWSLLQGFWLHAHDEVIKDERDEELTNIIKAWDPTKVKSDYPWLDYEKNQYLLERDACKDAMIAVEELKWTGMLYQVRGEELHASKELNLAIQKIRERQNFTLKKKASV